MPACMAPLAGRRRFFGDGSNRLALHGINPWDETAA
jgi:hypothetical protein